MSKVYTLKTDNRTDNALQHMLNWLSVRWAQRNISSQCSIVQLKYFTLSPKVQCICASLVKKVTLTQQNSNSQCTHSHSYNLLKRFDTHTSVKDPERTMLHGVLHGVLAYLVVNKPCMKWRHCLCVNRLIWQNWQRRVLLKSFTSLGHIGWKRSKLNVCTYNKHNFYPATPSWSEVLNTVKRVHHK